jgi:hypothetical protein
MDYCLDQAVRRDLGSTDPAITREDGRYWVARGMMTLCGREDAEKVNEGDNSTMSLMKQLAAPVNMSEGDSSQRIRGTPSSSCLVSTGSQCGIGDSIRSFPRATACLLQVDFEMMNAGVHPTTRDRESCESFLELE